MSRLKQVRPAEMPEVLRVASELYAHDQAQLQQAQQAQELLAAAKEVGLPAEYLERAAAMVQTQRITRRRRRWPLGALAALVLALRAMFSSHSPHMRPYPASPAAESVTVRPAPAVRIGPSFPVDLSRHLTGPLDEPMLNTPGNDLSDLGPGLKTLRGVSFNVRGVILVGPGETVGGLEVMSRSG